MKVKWQDNLLSHNTDLDSTYNMFLKFENKLRSVNNTSVDVVPVARLEYFRALKFSRLESFRALQLYGQKREVY